MTIDRLADEILLFGFWIAQYVQNRKRNWVFVSGTSQRAASLSFRIASLPFPYHSAFKHILIHTYLLNTTGKGKLLFIFWSAPCDPKVAKKLVSLSECMTMYIKNARSKSANLLSWYRVTNTKPRQTVW